MGTWRKSSYSDGNGGQCVEVANKLSVVWVRDTKNNGTGPVLRVGANAWATFTKAIKTS
jgi:hypothetical protein